MRIDTILHDANNMITHVDNRINETLHAMRDAMSGQPGGQSFEVRTSRSVLWCWLHEREVAACQREDLNCDGETILTNDLTGEAAVHFDQARADRREIERRIHSLHKEAEGLMRLTQNYANRELAIDRAGVGRCEDCDRYCDGKERRLIYYRGKAFVCDMCRKRRERSDVA